MSIKLSPCPCGNKDTRWSGTEIDEMHCSKCLKRTVCGEWPNEPTHQPDESRVKALKDLLIRATEMTEQQLFFMCRKFNVRPQEGSEDFNTLTDGLRQAIEIIDQLRAPERESGELGRLRAEGWAVAVHNDYRLNGEMHTFWLLTKDGRAVKGEGRTDAEALSLVRQQVEDDRRKP